jgi:hypothetical protein
MSLYVIFVFEKNLSRSHSLAATQLRLVHFILFYVIQVNCLAINRAPRLREPRCRGFPATPQRVECLSLSLSRARALSLSISVSLARALFLSLARARALSL